VSALSVRPRSDRTQTANPQLQSIRLGPGFARLHGRMNAALSVRFDGCATRNGSGAVARLQHSNVRYAHHGCPRRTCTARSSLQPDTTIAASLIRKPVDNLAPKPGDTTIAVMPASDVVVGKTWTEPYSLAMPCGTWPEGTCSAAESTCRVWSSK
jgi:hypothetical protein